MRLKIFDIYIIEILTRKSVKNGLSQLRVLHRGQKWGLASMKLPCTFLAPRHAKNPGISWVFWGGIFFAQIWGPHRSPAPAGSMGKRRRHGAQMKKRQPQKAVAVFEPCGVISDVEGSCKKDANFLAPPLAYITREAGAISPRRRGTYHLRAFPLL